MAVQGSLPQAQLTASPQLKGERCREELSKDAALMAELNVGNGGNSGDLVVPSQRVHRLQRGPGKCSEGRTQNGSATFKSTGSACLDFFFHVHQLSEKDLVPLRLARAWAEDPLTALKLVMQLRAVRGSGKSDKGGFFAAAMWLYEKHPKTLLANLWLLPRFGCFKDLLELVRMAGARPSKGPFGLSLTTEGGGKRDKKALAEASKKKAKEKKGTRTRQATSDVSAGDKNVCHTGSTEDAYKALCNEVKEIFDGASKKVLAQEGLQAAAVRKWLSGRAVVEEDGFPHTCSQLLLPHETIKAANPKAAELQWQRMIQEAKAAGTFTDCISVVDVSHSMMGEPLEAAVALSLLIADISSEPWHGHIITFSEKAALCHAGGDTISERAEFVHAMANSPQKDLIGVFDAVLIRAQRFKVKEAGMVKRIYVFSDMEFDQASANDHWATDHEEIVRKYAEAGYQVPEIVYWNLSRHTTGSTPVCMSEPGVALVSGLSMNILSVLFKHKEMTPILVMNEALKGQLYDSLVVHD